MRSPQRKLSLKEENTRVAHAAFMKDIWCLTPSGESLLTRSYAVLQEIAQLQDEMKPYSEGVRGNVRMYANATAISELLPTVLAKFFTTHPHLTVDLQERLSMEIVQAVRDGLADIGVISALVRADGWKRFHIKKIGWCWSYPYATLWLIYLKFLLPTLWNMTSSVWLLTASHIHF